MNEQFYTNDNVVGPYSGIVYAERRTLVRLLDPALVPWRDPVLVEEVLTPEEAAKRKPVRFHVMKRLLAAVEPPPDPEPEKPAPAPLPGFRDDLPKLKPNAQGSLF